MKLPARPSTWPDTPAPQMQRQTQFFPRSSCALHPKGCDLSSYRHLHMFESCGLSDFTPWIQARSRVEVWI